MIVVELYLSTPSRGAFIFGVKLMQFDIRRDHKGRGWVVIRTDYTALYSQHAHIKSKQGCLTLIRLINLKIMPRSDYLRGSVRRLLDDDEYRQMKEYKSEYINVPQRR